MMIKTGETGMGIQEAYGQWSESYDSDKNPTRDLDQKVTRDALANSHFKTILEIGCGTGKNTSFLSQIGQRIHAIDFSRGMIEKAKDKVKTENVRFSIADITKRWPFDSCSSDLVVCNLVLEHIEDLAHVFAEAFRTLKPHGRFFVNELHPFKQYEGKKARFYNGEETIEVEAFMHHISDFLNAASSSGLLLKNLSEHWHEADQDKPPRLVSFLFEKEH